MLGVGIFVIQDQFFDLKKYLSFYWFWFMFSFKKDRSNDLWGLRGPKGMEDESVTSPLHKQKLTGDFGEVKTAGIYSINALDDSSDYISHTKCWAALCRWPHLEIQGGPDDSSAKK